MNCSVFLLESSCVAAFAAKFFRGISVAEALTNGLRSVFCQNIFQRFLKQISQSNIPLVIQAAGDDGSVAKDADLIFQAVAEYFAAAFLSGKIRPVKFIAVFQKNPVSDGGSFSPIHPGFREESFHNR